MPRRPGGARPCERRTIVRVEPRSRLADARDLIQRVLAHEMHERGPHLTRAVVRLDLDRARSDLPAEMLLVSGDGFRVVGAVDGRGVAEALRGGLDPVLPQVVE